MKIFTNFSRTVTEAIRGITKTFKAQVQETMKGPFDPQLRPFPLTLWPFNPVAGPFIMVLWQDHFPCSAASPLPAVLGPPWWRDSRAQPQVATLVVPPLV